MEKRKRVDLDLIRCCAIIFVITVHGLSYAGFYELSKPSLLLLICHLIRCIVITCVPLFLILTGYLSSEKRYTYSIDYFKKLIRLIAIYTLCALICSIPKFIRGEFGEFFVAFFEFKAAPYAWYLAMYLGLYLLIPILNDFLSNENIRGGGQKLFVLIVLVVLPTITNNFDFNSTEWWNASKEQASQLLPNYWDELYPIMYYMIGAYLKRYDVVVNKLKNKRLIFGGALLGFSVINYFKNLGSAFVWNWATSYGGYQCLIIAVLFFCALLGTDTKNNKITFIIHSVAKYSFGMYLISWPIDIVVYKVMNVLMPQSAQMYLLPISIFCVSVCSYIGAIIVTKIADVLIQIAGFFAKSQKRMR